MAHPVWHTEDQKILEESRIVEMRALRPDNVSKNDLLIVLLRGRGYSITSVPDGWTLIREEGVTSSTRPKFWAYWKWATDNEPEEWIWGRTGPTTSAQAQLSVSGRVTGDFTGFGNPISAHSGYNSGGDYMESCVLPSLTAGDDELLVCGFTANNTIDGIAVPENMTEIEIEGAFSYQKGGSARQNVDAGATGTRTWTWTTWTARVAGVMFTIKHSDTPPAQARATGVVPIVKALPYHAEVNVPPAQARAQGVSPDVTALVVEHAEISVPPATAHAYGVVPSQINIPVTEVSVYPAAASINDDEALIITATVLPEDASNKTVFWSSSNTNVATVSGGIVKAINEGSAVITAETEDGSFTDVCVVTVTKYAPVIYTALEVYQKNLTTVDHTINNNEIASLGIEKELGGNCHIAFGLPFDGAAVAHITPGKYIRCEEQFYTLESINMQRGVGGNPFLDVRATHIFFELENLQARKDVARYGTILDFLQELLSQYGVVVTAVAPDHPLYSTSRYVEYEAGNTVMDCLKTIFVPYFATYRLDNLRIIVIPDVGEVPDPSPAVEFTYAVNNQAITKQTDYSDIVTKLIAEGSDDIEYTAHAPAEIKNLYRMERERTVSFNGVSIQSDLKYLADRYLAHKQLPLTTYRLSVAELKHISNIDELYPGKNFHIDLGQRVKVKDTEFGLDIESVVQRYSYYPLEPWETSMVVIGDLKPYDITFTEPESDEGVPGTGGTDPGGGGYTPPPPPPEPCRVCLELYGLISTEEPPDPEEDETEYEEDCLWFKY